DEPFDFDERNYCLTGRQTHHKFSLGDKIRIKVATANLYRKQLDFDFVRKLSSSAPVTTGTKFYLEIPKKKGGKKKK
ncbi:MAG: hypothetical protein J6W02_05645, partial [Bacteroidaceae bacterium]|nr:hypothetical protein [Bacteroidaceae bacterium]